MNLNKQFLTENECYRTGRKHTVKGIMVHSTGCNQPNLDVWYRLWNQPRPGGRQVCVHAFVGRLADGSIGTYHQTLSWDMVGWHSGSGSVGNANFMGCIGFEICEDDLTDRVYFEKVYREAMELCAYLCKQYGLTEKNIICHYEGYKQGIASNHGDVMHWFPKHGKSMDTFRATVKELLATETKSDTDTEKETLAETTTTEYPAKLTSGYYRVRKTWKDSKSQVGAYRILKNAKAKADENEGYCVFDNDGNVVYAPSATKAETKTEVALEPYRVRICITNLNIRKDPGTNYGKTGQFTGAGVFTIIAESDGTGASKWGKLKSGAGWISLNYAAKL